MQPPVSTPRSRGACSERVDAYLHFQREACVHLVRRGAELVAQSERHASRGRLRKRGLHGQKLVQDEFAAVVAGLHVTIRAVVHPEHLVAGGYARASEGDRTRHAHHSEGFRHRRHCICCPSRCGGHDDQYGHGDTPHPCPAWAATGYTRRNHSGTSCEAATAADSQPAQLHRTRQSRSHSNSNKSAPKAYTRPPRGSRNAPSSRSVRDKCWALHLRPIHCSRRCGAMIDRHACQSAARDLGDVEVMIG